MFENIKLALHVFSTRHYARVARHDIMSYANKRKDMSVIRESINRNLSSDFIDLVQLVEDFKQYTDQANSCMHELFEALDSDEAIENNAVKHVENIITECERIRDITNWPSELQEQKNKFENIIKDLRGSGVVRGKLQDLIDYVTKQLFLQTQEARDLKKARELLRDKLVLPEDVIDYKIKDKAWHEMSVSKAERKTYQELDDEMKELDKELKKMADFMESINRRTANIVTKNKDTPIDKETIRVKAGIKHITDTLNKFVSLTKLEIDELITIGRYVITLVFRVSDDVDHTARHILDSLSKKGITRDNTPTLFKILDKAYNDFESKTKDLSNKNYYVQLTILHLARKEGHQELINIR